ncbi:MAG: hypothetical protein M5U01_36805 [Ardenticatenaceae bacterium]|nr:hypothetical protein [Ardenticatenaceae bacterium]
MDRSPNRGWVGGGVLILLGLLFLLARFVPTLTPYVVLLIGLGLFGLFLITQAYGALIPAGIVTGIGVGIVLASRSGGDAGGAAFMLSLGAGFLAIWVLGLLFRVPENHWWPLIPGSILILVGVAALGSRTAQTLLESLSNWWPLILIILGGWLILRQLQRPRHR